MKRMNRIRCHDPVRLEQEEIGKNEKKFLKR